MKIFTADEYRNMIFPVIRECGAFLRVSRKKGLFVSDAPARSGSIGEIEKALIDEFSIVKKGNLMYLTPRFSGIDEETANAIVEILKAEPFIKQKLIRQALSKSMREKNDVKREIFETLLKGENGIC